MRSRYGVAIALFTMAACGPGRTPVADLPPTGNVRGVAEFGFTSVYAVQDSATTCYVARAPKSVGIHCFRDAR